MKYAAILSLPDVIRPAALVAILSLSRWSMVYTTVRYPAARQVGLGVAYKVGAGARELVIATILAMLLVAPLGFAGLAAFGLAWAASMLLARAVMTKIPGLTGDTYGAIAECIEIAVAICIPAFHRAFSTL
jgi:adenosylcobinamide-GDP ribazoletransferase